MTNKEFINSAASMEVAIYLLKKFVNNVFLMDDEFVEFVIYSTAIWLDMEATPPDDSC